METENLFAKLKDSGAGTKIRTVLLVVVAVAALLAGAFTYKDTLLNLVGLGPQEEPSYALPESPTTPESPAQPAQADSQSPQSPALALSASCNAGKIEDCFLLAQFYKDENDSPKAIGALEPLCQKQNAPACAFIAGIYEGDANGAAGYLDYATKACNYGDIDTCYALAVKHYRGDTDGIKKDVMRSFYLFKKTCDKGKLEGCNNLAVIYNNGKGGVPKNLALAKSLFTNACKGGYKPSCKNLQKLAQSAQSN